MVVHIYNCTCVGVYVCVCGVFVCLSVCYLFCYETLTLKTTTTYIIDAEAFASNKIIF